MIPLVKHSVKTPDHKVNMYHEIDVQTLDHKVNMCFSLEPMLILDISLPLFKGA